VFEGGAGTVYMFLWANDGARDTVTVGPTIDGTAVVYDFEAAHDLISLQNTGWHSLGEVLAHLRLHGLRRLQHHPHQRRHLHLADGRRTQ
jgi:hypothetical protein